MMSAEITEAIKKALNEAPRNGYVGELHLQILKYAQELQAVGGKEFCEELGIGIAYGTEFKKMLKIWPRLKSAGLIENKI
ncbi:transcription factor [Pusillimonas sp. ANT_WB101]|uniref:HTH-like domain-containing protein n=1 Tax=Pusillimonas sp. ANT_WB101 TaxID=2597356 RepID=UPI0011F03B81|nr:transcription factor [Pusillimonas sp. ANT_WB101]KAA0890254.1 transcription factor [Pusillimonas sp. ANT_WB101]